ncbi:MAG: hypothetical protein AABY34_00875 [Pseudomonadota bacterium]
MALIFNLVYFLTICGLGMPLAARLKCDPFQKLIAGFLFGSIITAFYLFFVTEWMLATPGYILGFTLLSLIIASFYIKTLWTTLKSIGCFLREHLIKQDRWSVYFIGTLIFLIVWIILLAYTPERSADAMRYHLAQMKDIVLNHGFVFRPYIHYNFPIFFHLMFLPSFILFGGVGVELAVCLYFLFSLLILQYLAARVNLKHTRLFFIILFLTPLAYHEAHIVTNDWIVIFYSLIGFLFLTTDSHKKSSIYIAFAALGFALGVKYQSILFIPWYIILAYTQLEKEKKTPLINALILMTLIASPCYIRNYINLGNPVWPLAQNIFGSSSHSIQIMAQKFTSDVSGHHNINSIIVDIKAFLLDPLIPVTLWILIIAGAIFTRIKKLQIRLGLITYFMLWWIVEPTFYIRFAFYALPIGLLIAIKYYDNLQNKSEKLVCNVILVITLSYFIVLAPYYSIFYIKYYFHPNLDQYHQYTWNYGDYQWIKQHTAKNAKILCILRAGQTYYLDRPYLSAEPNLSGLIDWQDITNTKQLVKILKNFNINYIFYEKHWSNIPGGANMDKLLDNLIKEHYAKHIFAHTENLSFSRIRNTVQQQTFYLIKLIH